jgi:hypothetical protein
MQTFSGAVLSMMAMFRQYDLDSTLAGLAGVDEFAANATALANAEGGWDQLHALASVGTVGLNQIWFACDPNRGNFDAWRTGWQGPAYISGTGPISSGLPSGGWTEVAPWPGVFLVPKEESSPQSSRLGLDAITIETVGFDQYPWYDVYNTYLPSVPLASTVIWWPLDKETRCAWIKFAQWFFAGTAFIMATPLGKKLPGADKAAAGVAFAFYTISQFYCK